MGYPKGMDIEELLKREEGFSPYVYRDSEGYWTIGYGLLVDERKGEGLAEEDALYLLRKGISRRRAVLEAALPWIRDLDQTRQTVLLAMTYQMGVAGVLKFKNTLAALRAQDFARAARGIRGSKWAQQTPGRAERMAKAIETGVLA